jgi:hypothetical protein
LPVNLCVISGLRGVSFGNFLIKQVVEELKTELMTRTALAQSALLHSTAEGKVTPTN